MSSFSNKGKRVSVRKDNKKRLVEVMSILDTLDDVAVKMIESKVQISEDNLIAEAKKYTDIPLGNLEASLILSKLKHFEESLEEKRLEVHGSKGNV